MPSDPSVRRPQHGPRSSSASDLSIRCAILNSSSAPPRPARRRTPQRLCVGAVARAGLGLRSHSCLPALLCSVRLCSWMDAADQADCSCGWRRDSSAAPATRHPHRTSRSGQNQNMPAHRGPPRTTSAVSATDRSRVRGPVTAECFSSSFITTAPFDPVPCARALRDIAGSSLGGEDIFIAASPERRWEVFQSAGVASGVGQQYAGGARQGGARRGGAGPGRCHIPAE